MPLKDPVARREYMRLYARRYQKEHPERRYKHTLKWRKAHWDKHLDTAKRYRERHRERVRETMRAVDARRNQTEERKKYRKDYKRVKVAQIQQYNKTAAIRRKLRLGENGGTCTYKQWLEKCAFYGWKCAYCGTQLSDKRIEVDHVKPVAKGGSGWVSNLVPACRSCNAKKNTAQWLPRFPGRGK